MIKYNSIKDIIDGWKLKNGDLYLLIKCEDKIIRSIIININDDKYMKERKK